MAGVAGLTCLALAVAPPLAALAHDHLSAHMAQHVVLLAVAAPLLALGALGPTLAWATPTTTRRRLLAGWQQVARRPAGRWWAVWTTAALCLHVATMWVWHAPVLYQAAVEHPGVHVLEHATLVATAVVFWWTVVAARRRSASGAGVMALFGGALAATALGAAMTLASRPWYPRYGEGAAALEDQQVAGVVMWGFGGAVALVTATALFGSTLAAMERRTPGGTDRLPARLTKPVR